MGPSQFHAFRWTAATGLRYRRAGVERDPRNASHDGSVIIGYSDAAFRWTRSTRMLPLQSSTLYTDAYGISADGAVVVGYIDNFPFPLDGGWRLRNARNSPGRLSCRGMGRKARGNVIAGTSYGGGDRPFIWTRAGGMQPIGYGERIPAVNVRGISALMEPPSSAMGTTVRLPEHFAGAGSRSAGYWHTQWQDRS